MIDFWWPSRGPRLPQPADGHTSAAWVGCATVPDEDLFDHVRLGRFDERHHRHLAAALGATQWVYFVDPLDQHGPGLAATRSCGLLPHPARLVRITSRPASVVGVSNDNSRFHPPKQHRLVADALILILACETGKTGESLRHNRETRRSMSGPQPPFSGSRPARH